MVKIFTLDELIKQKIPKKEDYQTTVDQIKKRYQKMFAAGQLYGALLYGSVFKNNGQDFLIGSDIDQIAIVNNLNQPTMDQLCQLRQEINPHVPVEFHIFDVDIIQDGYHGYDKTFLEDLRIQAKPDG